MDWLRRTSRTMPGVSSLHPETEESNAVDDRRMKIIHMSGQKARAQNNRPNHRTPSCAIKLTREPHAADGNSICGRIKIFLLFILSGN